LTALELRLCDLDSARRTDFYQIERIHQWTHRQSDAPIVIAKDKQTDHIFMFTTAHVTGMDLVNPVATEATAENGDIFIKGLIPHMDRLSTDNSAAIEIFGADMNSNLQKWRPRFDMLSHAGFSTHSTGQPTEVFPVQPEYVERELDHVFSRVAAPTPPSMLEAFLGISRQTARLAARASVLMDFNARNGEVPENASDHRRLNSPFAAPEFFNVRTTLRLNQI
jgi:hypothetical protein